MDYRHLFRQMGIISRQAMMNMNHEASQYNLDNNLFLILIRIVEHAEGQVCERCRRVDETVKERSYHAIVCDHCAEIVEEHFAQAVTEGFETK